MDELIFRVRKRLLQMHRDAKVGHVGSNLSCLEILVTLYHRVLRPQDRFVLSKGHSAGALYATLWSMGRLTDDDLNTFHGEGTRLPGHPPLSGIDDILFATGSLGHGLPIACGLALAARMQGSGRRIFCVTSDGEWQEGSNWEAMIFAVHHKLDNLCVIIDANGLQGFGSVAEVASNEPLEPRLAAFGADVLQVDGHDPVAIEAATRNPTGAKPVFIVAKTIKGKGIARFESSVASHYLPITDDDYRDACAADKTRA